MRSRRSSSHERTGPISAAFARSAFAGLRLFLQGAWLSYVALFHWLQPATYLASKVVMPLAQMLFFVFVGTFGSTELPASFFVIGNAMQMAAVSGIYGITFAIGGDRWDGTLIYLLGTPARRLLILFGRAAAHIVDGVIGVVAGFLWGRLLLGVDFSAANMGRLALAIAITVLSTSGLGLLMGCIGLITRNVLFVNNTVYFLLLLLSGANIPLQSLPPWMGAIASVLPLSRGILAARLIMAGGPAGEALRLLAGEAAVGLAYLLAGYFLFRVFEAAAKRRGSLETV